MTCLQSSDCSNNEVCDTTSGSCVGCLSTSDCSTGELCNTASNTCVLCLTNSDCATDFQCITSEGKCGKECATFDDCNGNTVCTFTTTPFSCTPKSCNHNRECPGSYCESNLCVIDPIPPKEGCTSNADCTEAGFGCDTSVGECKLTCEVHTDCGGPQAECHYPGGPTGETGPNGLALYYCIGRTCNGDHDCAGTVCGESSDPSIAKRCVI